ncbi:hypothetical protein IAU60_002878 [Kwoniella sp. DSM 27419]
MSHRRSNFGRFQSGAANESFQRQLTAPVNRWKRQWVAPTGLAPESSYKICKWVKINEKAKLAGAISEIGDDATPAPDGDNDEGDEGDDNDNDNEDEGMEEDQEEGDGDEGEGEGEGEEEGEGEGEGEGEAEGEAEAEGEGNAEKTAGETKTDASAVPAEGAVAAAAAVDTADPLETTAEPTVGASVKASAETDGTQDEASHEAVIPPHQAIPSNAMDITNVAPQATETGLGEVTNAEGGIEIHTRPAEEAVQAVTEEAPVADEAMDVDAAAVAKEEPVQSEATAAPAQAEETPLEKDEGLVMGEMEPPAEVAELAVEGGDQPPAEVEQ